MDCLEIDSVELYFGEKTILNNVYLKAETGKITGILGSNGCGKSTLLRIIFGELTPKYKSLRLNQKFIKGPFFKSDLVKFMPQYPIMPKSMYLNKLFQSFNLNIDKFIKEFPSFESVKHQRFRNLSGGERRVVETYLILCAQSKFVLLDEPFSHIAPVYIEKIIQLIHREKRSKAIIVTDHMYKYIDEISDDLYLMKDGWTKRIENKNDLSFFRYANI